MGHREDLLAGAKRCIVEKGLAHTTARDIVAASGTNLASIGYHFGSKDALLTAAIIDSFDDWDDEVEAAARGVDEDTPADRLAAILTTLLDALGANRPLFAAGLHALAEAEFIPQVREQIAAAYRRGRRELPAAVLQMDQDEIDDDVARGLGSLGMALVNGLVLQHLIDPEHAPSAHDLIDAVQALTRS